MVNEPLSLCHTNTESEHHFYKNSQMRTSKHSLRPSLTTLEERTLLSTVPVLILIDNGGTYNGTPFVATATANGQGLYNSPPSRDVTVKDSEYFLTTIDQELMLEAITQYTVGLQLN